MLATVKIQVNRKTTPASQFTVDGDIASHQLYKLAAERQTQFGPLLGFAAAFRLSKHIKKRVHFFRGNARAGVLN